MELNGLYSAVQNCRHWAVLHCRELSSTLLCCTAVNKTAQNRTLPCSTVQCCTVPYSTMRYCTELFSTVKYGGERYSTVHIWMVFGICKGKTNENQWFSSSFSYFCACLFGSKFLFLNLFLAVSLFSSFFSRNFRTNLFLKLLFLGFVHLIDFLDLKGLEST